MRIAIVSREMPPTSATPAALAAGGLVDDALRCGWTVHVIAQRLSRTALRESKGRLRAHRMALPPPIVAPERLALVFACEAGKRVIELHDRGDVDGAVFVDVEAPGICIAAMNQVRTSGVPIVVLDTGAGAASAGSIEGIARALTGATVAAAAAPGRLADLFGQAIAEPVENGRRTRSRLDAWRRAQQAAASQAASGEAA